MEPDGVSPLRLGIGEPLPFGRTRAAPRHLEALTARVADDADLSLATGTIDHMVTATSVAALLRAFAMANDLGMRAWLDVEAGGEPSSPCPNGDVVHHRQTPMGSLVVRSTGDVVGEHVELGGAPLRATWVSDTGVAMEVYALSVGSPRLQAHLQNRQMVRGKPMSADAMAASDEIPSWPALQRFEEAVGGLIAPWRRDPIERPELLLGLGLCLDAPDGLRAAWCWQPEDDEDEDETELELLRWPRFSYRGRELVFVGEFAHRHYLLLDEGGAIWQLEDELGLMDVLAGDPWTLLEGMARDAFLWTRPAWAKVTVSCDAGNAVAAALSLEREDCASDDIVQAFANDGLWLRQVAAREPLGPRLEIVGDEVGQVVRAVERTRREAPGASVRVQETRPGGPERARALRAAGLL